jgi:hypothetical protein
MDAHAGELWEIADRTRHCEVDVKRHDITQVMDIQRGFVGDNRPLLAHRKPCRHNVLER